MGGQTIEFLIEYSGEVRKTAAAFLNTNAGTIYIGMDGDGRVRGVADPDDVLKRVCGDLEDGVRPDCSRFFKADAVERDGKTVVRINVNKGTRRPYYLAEKGPVQGGVFIRTGSTTVQAQEEKIRELIKRDDNDSYETGLSIRQDLSFDYAEKIFAQQKMSFTDNNKITLGLMKEDGFYTNLALLLSEQCAHTVKCAVFEGTTRDIFKDRAEFGGSLFRQLDDTLRYLNFYNKTPSEIVGYKRVDSRDYSEAVVREAVLNAIIHRDYGYPDSILVSLYEDRLEIMSIGGLVDGVSKEAIMSGISRARNPGLARIFYRLRYVETYGVGIPRIFDDYRNLPAKPEINVFRDAFRITIPNKTYVRKAERNLPPDKEEERKRLILDEIAESGSVDNEKTAAMLGVGTHRAYVILEDLTQRGILASGRRGRRKIYFRP